MLLLLLPLHHYAAAKNTRIIAAAVNPADSLADSKTFALIVSRVNEIQAMDKSHLTAGEKKELRRELRSLKQKADGLNDKIYISIGGIIIIILLLILILR
ncbi:hypothetical protein GCM10027043_10890 [Ferruginibacter profundus]